MAVFWHPSTANLADCCLHETLKTAGKALNTNIHG